MEHVIKGTKQILIQELKHDTSDKEIIDILALTGYPKHGLIKYKMFIFNYLFIMNASLFVFLQVTL